MLESFKHVTVEEAKKIRGVSSKVCVILQKLSVRSKQIQLFLKFSHLKKYYKKLMYS